MKQFKEAELRNVIWGATLMGAGGGGSLQSGLDMLDTYKKQHPAQEPSINLIETHEMAEGSFAAVTAGMGAPSAIVGIDFSPYAINAFKALQEVAGRIDRELSYCIPVEIGGFNTFVPMMISMETGFSFLDADGCGRAVPALETLLLHINGCQTSPLTMTNDVNDKITIELSDPYNAGLAEKLGRDVCIEFGMKSGLAGWMVNREEVEKNIVTGSISLVEKVGDIFRNTEDKSILFEELIKKDLVPTKLIDKGEVVKVYTDPDAGFDKGYVIIKGANGLYKVDFLNENLVLSVEISDGSFKPIMTVPDIICMYCIEPPKGSRVIPGMPLSNADVEEGMRVGLGVIKVNEKWFNNPEKMWSMWTSYLKGVGYTGPNLPYDQMKI